MFTTIAVSVEVRDKLSSLKVVPRESYSDVLKRLLDGYKGPFVVSIDEPSEVWNG